MCLSDMCGGEWSGGYEGDDLWGSMEEKREAGAEEKKIVVDKLDESGGVRVGKLTYT